MGDISGDRAFQNVNFLSLISIDYIKLSYLFPPQMFSFKKIMSIMILKIRLQINK